MNFENRNVIFQLELNLAGYLLHAVADIISMKNAGIYAFRQNSDCCMKIVVWWCDTEQLHLQRGAQEFHTPTDRGLMHPVKRLTSLRLL